MWTAGRSRLRRGPGCGYFALVQVHAALNMNSIQTQRPDLILVIDDDKKTLESVRRLLESEGFVVHTSASPVEGIKSYETHLAEIKLVLNRRTLSRVFLS